MDQLEKLADRRKKWVESLQVQIRRMRKEAEPIAELRRKNTKPGKESERG